MAHDLLKQIKLQIVQWQVDAETEHRNDIQILEENVNSMLQLKGFTDEDRTLIVDWIHGIIDGRLAARMQTKIQMTDGLRRTEIIRELRA